MADRRERISGQDGLAAQIGQKREGRNGAYLYTDPRTGIVYWARDANLLGEDDSADRYQGGYNSPFAQLGDVIPTRGKHSKRFPSGE